MSPNKAIKQLRILITPNMSDLKRKAIDKAISALEKQIPKKPDYEGDDYDDNGYLVYDTYYCPCCFKTYEVDYDKYDYCPNCGQALDWSCDD